jgi:hypothetical protein
MPADADPLSSFPSNDARTYGIDDAGDLMAGNSRILNAWKGPLLSERVAVTDSTGLDFDSHQSNPGFRDVALDQLKGGVWAFYLHRTHL